MNRGLVLNLVGRAGAGKNLTAEIIQNLYPEHDFEIAAFADPLKEVVATLTGIYPPYTQEQKERFLPGWGMTIRDLLQRVGTDAIRNQVHPDAWVMAAQNRFCDGGNVIFADCRFPNELTAQFRGAHTVAIRVVRPNNPIPPMDHPSETALDNADIPHTIHNDGTVGLVDEVKRVMKNIL